MQQTRKIKGLVVSHSHWDRAWYLPFESYRHRLVRMTDRILDLLENNPDYRSFMFDGQTILLEDYLGVRPDAAPRLRRLIETRRLLIGPWYVLPDLFLVSGESVIRNLQAGASDGKTWGELLKVGYVPDPFGHFAQLPQILSQFELDSFMFMRGMHEHDFDRLGSIFDWVAPDGSRVVATYMIDGYFNASALGYPSVYGRFEGLQPDLAMAEERVRATMDKYAAIQPEPWVVLFNGMDHMPEQAELPQLLDSLRGRDLPFDLEHSDLDEYSRSILAYKRERPTFCGDLDGNAHHPILKGVWSSRVYLKLENHRLESLLTGFVEPLVLLAGDRNLIRHDPALMNRVWRKLMKNHPHDDICGCSLDDVHFDNELRFQQAGHMAEELVTEILEQALIRGISHPADDGRPAYAVARVLVHNPHPFPVASWVETEVFFPNPEGEDGDPPPNMPLEAHDGVGAPVEVQILHSEAPVVRNQFLGATWGRRYHVRMWVSAPPAGYTIVRVQPSEQTPAQASYLPSGKSLGSLWEQALLEWRPDLGDTYSYGPDPEGSVWETPAVIGPESDCLIWSMPIPASREGGSTDIIVTGTVQRLDQGGHSIRVEYTNKARDGRLRLLLPLGEQVDYSLADGHFRLAEHRVGTLRTPESASERWNGYPGELDYGTNFMRDGVIVPRVDAAGLWLAGRGSHEYEIVQHAALGCCLAVTLHRSVGMLSVGGGRIRRVQAGPSVPVPGAQCLRDIKIELALGPVASDHATAHRAMKAFAHPPQARLFPWLPYVDGTGDLPAAQSLLSIDNPSVVLSALRRHESDTCWVVRVYSTGSSTETCTLQFPSSKSLACLTDLHERWDDAEAFALDSGSLTLEIPPHRIVTLLVR